MYTRESSFPSESSGKFDFENTFNLCKLQTSPCTVSEVGTTAFLAFNVWQQHKAIGCCYYCFYFQFNSSIHVPPLVLKISFQV